MSTTNDNPCAPVKKCPQSKEDCAEDEKILVTNEECTDQHTGSDPNDLRGCDSSKIPDYVNASNDYEKMRQYQLAQNCVSIGYATRTGGIRSGMNKDALMMADIQSRGARGKKEKATFKYPDNASVNDLGKGFDTEAESYLNKKNKYSKSNTLRKADFNTLNEFNTDGDIRREVVDAALLTDPLCNNIKYDCGVKCDNESRESCLNLSSQCGYQDYLECATRAYRIIACLDKDGNVIDCSDNAGAVDRKIEMDKKEECDAKNGCTMGGKCIKYKNTKGTSPTSREAKTQCYNKRNEKVSCGARKAGKVVFNKDVEIQALEIPLEMKCFAGTTQIGTTDKACMANNEYKESITKVTFDDGNPYNTRVWNRSSATEDWTQTFEDKSGSSAFGKCSFLEMEQLTPAYECCKKEKTESLPLIQYYNTLSEVTPGSITATGQSATAEINAATAAANTAATTLQTI